MNKKFKIALLVSGAFLLASCGKLEKGTSSISPNSNAKDKAVATAQVDSGSYQALLIDGKYRTSQARGLTANRLNSNYNSINFERGLLELSKEHFAVNDFYFQEGQLFSREEVIQLFSRNPKESKKGLNPESGPIVFQQIVEQNYINKKSEKLEGISIGIALNQVDYSSDPVESIDDATILAEGQRIAPLILMEIRSKDGMDKIPVTIGLFKQAPKDNIAGGSYYSTAYSSSGDKLDKWQDVNEDYFVLGTGSNDKTPPADDGLENKFTDFKNNIQRFFPNTSGISGVASYRNNELVKFTIVIESKYFGETEMINFTQFVSGSVETIFTMNGNIEVQINTLNAPKGLVKKEVGSDQVQTTIFN